MDDEIITGDASRFDDEKAGLEFTCQAERIGDPWARIKELEAELMQARADLGAIGQTFIEFAVSDSDEDSTVNRVILAAAELEDLRDELYRRDTIWLPEKDSQIEQARKWAKAWKESAIFHREWLATDVSWYRVARHGEVPF